MSSYRIHEKLGEGGMGVVYLATQRSLDRKVALKLLTQASRENSSFVSRFLREIQASSRVSHPNIIKILDYGQIEDQMFYAMEYIEAPTLERYYKKRAPLPVADLVAIGVQLADALACMHRSGLVHRDLKPSNVMISAEGHITLMDFGLVKDLSGTAMTAAGKIVGTPSYLAPETILGQAPDGRADLFSLGILLHELATGTRPFQRETMQALLVAIVREPAEPLAALRPDLPPWLAAIIDRLLAKDRDNRFPSATAVARELKRGRGEAVPRDADEDSVDTVVDFSGDSDNPVNSGSIEGGIAALAAAPVRERPRLTGLVRPLRTTTRVPAAAPPPAVGARGFGLAALGGVAAVALALALAGTRPRPAPVPSAAASIAAAMAAGQTARTPLDVGAALDRALGRLRPLERIAELHADLVRSAPTKRGWFDRDAPNEVRPARMRGQERLIALAAECELERELRAFTPVKEDYFERAEPAARWALYQKLHELLDLELWCARSVIAFAPGAKVALPERYGRLAAPRLAGAPGFVFRFAIAERYIPESLRLLVPPRGIDELVEKDAERFFAPGDSRETDLITGLENANKSRFKWRSADVLPLPPGPELGELELFGAAADLADNNRFVVSLIEEGRPPRDVAIVRGRGSPLVPVVHTVERSLLGPGPWRLAIRFQIIQDMMAWTEYANFPQVGFRYRRKR